MDLTIKKKRLYSMDEPDHTKDSKLMTVDDSKYVAFPPANVRNTPEPYDHMKDAAFFYDATEQFKKLMRLDPDKKCNYEVTMISKATLSGRYLEEYKNKLQTLSDPSMVADMYYCGSLEHPERTKDILKHGFTEADFCHGEYGRGLYFSKFPFKAAQFSEKSKILLVEVGLGNMETVTKPDKVRKSPSPGHDSIIVPGRLVTKTSSSQDNSMAQEYVVFDVKQVQPLCLITYASSS